MFGKLVPVPSGAVIPERDIGKRPILNCINLGVTFGGLKAVDDFNLMIGRTEIAGLIGPNGAGKTTVFNLLTKVYQPTHGTILLDGQDTHNMTTAQVNRAGIARTFQNIRLFNDLTVEENVTVAMDAQMKYSMVSGIFRLPSFWKEEKVAHERALELLNNSEFTVKVLKLPNRLVDGKYVKQDADDFIKFQGPDAFERLLNGSENGVEFRMAQIAGKYDLKDDEARIAYCGEVSELLASLPGAVEREIYTGRAAEAAGITAEAMKLEVQRSFKRRIAREKRAELRKNLNPAMALQPKERSLRFENMRSAEAEKGILRLLLTDDTLFSDTIPIPPERFSSPLLSRAYQRLWEVHAAGSRPMISSLGEEFSREEIDCLTAVCQEPVSTQHAQQALTDYINVINSEADKRTAQDDPLLAAVEKFKNKKRGKQHV